MNPNFFYLYSPNSDSQETLYYTPSGHFIKVLKISNLWIPQTTQLWKAGILVKGIQDIQNLQELREASLEEKFLFTLSWIKFSTSWGQFIPRYGVLLEHFKKIQEQLIGGKTLHPLVMNRIKFLDGEWVMVLDDLMEITDEFGFLTHPELYNPQELGWAINILTWRRNFYKQISGI